MLQSGQASVEYVAPQHRK